LLKRLIVIWGVCNTAIYLLSLGFSVVGAAETRRLPPIVTLVAAKIGMNPKIFALVWWLSFAGMLLGIMLQLVLEQRWHKQSENAIFMEQWQKAHKNRASAL